MLLLVACGGGSQISDTLPPEVKILPTIAALTPLATPTLLPAPSAKPLPPTITSTPEVTLSANSHLESGNKYVTQGIYQKALFT